MPIISKDDIEDRVLEASDIVSRINNVATSEDYLPLIRDGEHVKDKDLSGANLVTYNNFTIDDGDSWEEHTDRLQFDLSRTDLSGYKFNGARIGDLAIATARDADFSNAEIHELELSGDARGALFIGTKFDDFCPDHNTDVDGAVFIGAEFKYPSVKNHLPATTIVTTAQLAGALPGMGEDKIIAIAEALETLSERHSKGSPALAECDEALALCKGALHLHTPDGAGYTDGMNIKSPQEPQRGIQ